LTAETNEGVFYHGEAMSKPVNSSDEPATAEEVGQLAANRLLTEIFKVHFYPKFPPVNIRFLGRMHGHYSANFGNYFHGSL
jgi:hypothetical protein